MINASMPLSMNHSPIDAPANGAKYCAEAGASAPAATTIVSSNAPAFSSSAMTRAMFDCFWPTAT